MRTAGKLWRNTTTLIFSPTLLSFFPLWILPVSFLHLSLRLSILPSQASCLMRNHNENKSKTLCLKMSRAAVSAGFHPVSPIFDQADVELKIIDGNERLF
jgi:hypothetical protein